LLSCSRVQARPGGAARASLKALPPQSIRNKTLKIGAYACVTSASQGLAPQGRCETLVSNILTAGGREGHQVRYMKFLSTGLGRRSPSNFGFLRLAPKKLITSSTALSFTLDRSESSVGNSLS